MSPIYYYNIHKLITVSSEVALPELERFMVHAPIAQPTIQVQIGKSPRFGNPATPEPGVRYICYDENVWGMPGFRAEIENSPTGIRVWASQLVGASPHVLYTNVVEPILRWTFVEKGYALVHGACIDFAGKAYLVTARTDTGKTTTLLKILSRQRRVVDTAGFLSDDLTLIAPDGTAMTYPKPLTISHHTVQAINAKFLNLGQRLALLVQSRIHSRSGRLFAQLLAATRLPMASVNAMVQIIVPPPKYHVTQLVPQVKLTPQAHLTGMFIIERFWKGGEVALKSGEALEILLNNCDDAYGFPPYDSIKEFLYKVDGRDLREVERGIIAQAFQGLPATLVCSDNMSWWRKIPGLARPDIANCFQDRPRAPRFQFFKWLRPTAKQLNAAPASGTD